MAELVEYSLQGSPGGTKRSALEKLWLSSIPEGQTAWR